MSKAKVFCPNCRKDSGWEVANILSASQAICKRCGVTITVEARIKAPIVVGDAAPEPHTRMLKPHIPIPPDDYKGSTYEKRLEQTCQSMQVVIEKIHDLRDKMIERRRDTTGQIEAEHLPHVNHALTAMAEIYDNCRTEIEEALAYPAESKARGLRSMFGRAKYHRYKNYSEDHLASDLQALEELREQETLKTVSVPAERALGRLREYVSWLKMWSGL